jgi:hypothetical protein
VAVTAPRFWVVSVTEMTAPGPAEAGAVPMVTTSRPDLDQSETVVLFDIGLGDGAVALASAMM